MKQIVILVSRVIRIALLAAFCLLLAPGATNCFSQSRDVPFTLEDRDRIIQIEEKLNSMNTRFESVNDKFESVNDKFESVNDKFESQQQQLNDLKNIFYWGFGMLFTLMLFIFGYIIWDRKTVTEPIREHTQSLIQTLREYAKEQPKLTDILRSYGLL